MKNEQLLHTHQLEIRNRPAFSSTTQQVITITTLPVAVESEIMKFTSIVAFGENANTFGEIGNTPRVFKISFGVK